MSGVISSAAARVRGNQDHLFVSASDFVIENYKFSWDFSYFKCMYNVSQCISI